MYIRLKIWSRKSNNKFDNPIFFVEINGDNALKLLIYKIVEKYFGNKTNEKVKNIIEKALEDIKDVINSEDI